MFLQEPFDSVSKAPAKLQPSPEKKRAARYITILVKIEVDIGEPTAIIILR